jgi:CDP-diacylglycerol--glycerol-3-phosphate 3-phosphatidyltransferase/cardiolipin synthase
MTWANRITIFRILLIPVFVALLLYYEKSTGPTGPDERLRWAALIVFAVASLSDALDGYLARHCGQASKLGAILDPIADKLLMLAALVVLGFLPLKNLPSYPLWFPIVILSRDALLLLGFILLRYLHVSFDVKPHWTGKVSTFFQLSAIIAVLLKCDWVWEVCAAGALFTLASTLIYLNHGTKLIRLSGFADAPSKLNQP